MRRAPLGALGNECSSVRDVFRRWRWLWASSCAPWPRHGNGDGSLRVECCLHWEAPKSVRRQRGFISKGIVPRRQHRGVSPPCSVCPHDIQPKSCWDWGEELLDTAATGALASCGVTACLHGAVTCYGK